MKSSIRLTIFAAMLVAAVPAAFALSGHTFYHYVAYEAAFWPKTAPVTAAQYPKIALNSLQSLPFDTLVFAPVFGFGSMAGILKSATYPTHQPQSRWLDRWKNAMPELVKAGIDPIAETVKWCRGHKREAVVALPVNLIGPHGAKPTSENPITSWHAYLWPAFKAANPDCLMDSTGQVKIRFANRLAVDYTHAKVRDTFASIAGEITSKYDVDGLLVDFMMSPTLLRSVAEGGTAAPKEVELVTQMMQRLKTSCKAASARLGHPVALLARVPDSAGYCKDVGIDLEGWLGAKLLDGVVLGGTFQLNRWNVTGDLAVKAGVPYYVSFAQSGIYVGNDSGYMGDDERVPRHSKPACRARIADALLCKAGGCMYTMGMHWEHSLGNGAVVPFDAKANRLADKRYFVSYTNDRGAGSTLNEWAKYRTVGSLLSGSPVDLSKGIAKATIEVWDDLAALKREGVSPKVTLITEVSIPSGIETIVHFNGKELKPFKKRAGTQLYDLTSLPVRFGANEVTVKAKGRNRRGQTATFGNVVVEVVFPKAEGGGR